MLRAALFGGRIVPVLLMLSPFAVIAAHVDAGWKTARMTDEAAPCRAMHRLLS